MSMRRISVSEDGSAAGALRRWFGGHAGGIMAALEARLLGALLPNLFGYHIVQLGCHHPAALLESSRISHRVIVDLECSGDETAKLSCSEDALPFASAAVDVLVLPHVLEFTDDPRRVLREAERVLIGEGHIVVLGFNPWSWMGLWSLVRRWQGRAPWNGSRITVARVRDWLELLGFDILRVERVGFRPPLSQPRLSRRLAFAERLGAFGLPALGNAYAVLARKRVEGVTPLRASWRERRSLVAGGVAEPSAREACGGGESARVETR